MTSSYQEIERSLLLVWSTPSIRMQCLNGSLITLLLVNGHLTPGLDGQGLGLGLVGRRLFDAGLGLTLSSLSIPAAYSRCISWLSARSASSKNASASLFLGRSTPVLRSTSSLAWRSSAHSYKKCSSVSSVSQHRGQMAPVLVCRLAIPPATHECPASSLILVRVAWRPIEL